MQALLTGWSIHPEYLQLNPNGTVPTLIDGDNPPLWESCAILRYLAAAYGPESFWPSQPQHRARVDQWAEWSKLNTALAFTSPIFWKVVRTAPSKQNPVEIRNAMLQLATCLRIADRQLQNHQFLTSDHFTLADIVFGHWLFRYFDIDLDRPELPNLHRYHENLATRSAYREHVMVSYEELRVYD